MDSIVLTSEPLSLDAAVRFCQHASVGGIATFVGTTRDTFEGRPVARLEYTAYESMATKELQRVANAMRAKWPSLVATAVHHRLGVVPVCDMSVIIVAAAPHRRDALDAVAFAIDLLKSTVPIWKKEIYADSGDGVWKENCCQK